MTRTQGTILSTHASPHYTPLTLQLSQTLLTDLAHREKVLNLTDHLASSCGFTKCNSLALEPKDLHSPRPLTAGTLAALRSAGGRRPPSALTQHARPDLHANPVNEIRGSWRCAPSPSGNDTSRMWGIGGLGQGMVR